MTEQQPTSAATWRLSEVSNGVFSRPTPPLTPEECLQAGGHCHDRTGYSRLSSPPQYEERCKHCGDVRWAIPRDPFEYRSDT